MSDKQRVEYGCKLCPKESRANFGDPEHLPRLVTRDTFAAWMRRIAGHVFAVHPLQVDTKRPINDYLEPTYF